MESLLHFLTQHGVLSSAQYWHLRLLSAIAFGPLLGVLYLVLRNWGRPRKPTVDTGPSMWVSSDGQLFMRRTRPQTPA